MKQNLFLFLAVLFCFNGFAQNGKQHLLSGKVMDNKGELLPYVAIGIFNIRVILMVVLPISTETSALS